MNVNNKKRYAYGLDISMKTTGIAIMDMDTYEVVYTGSVTTKDKDCYGEKLYDQSAFVGGVLKNYPPEICFYEKGFTQFNTATQVIYRAVGVYNLLLRKYPDEYYAPTTVKKIITGNGRASKDLLKEVLLERYPNIKLKNTDESDALGVVITGMIKKYKMDW